MVALTRTVVWAALGVAAGSISQQAWAQDDDDLREAQTLITAGHYENAVRQIEAILDQSGAAIPLRTLLVRALLTMGKRKDAAIAVKALLDRRPTNVEALALARDVFATIGDKTREHETLEQARLSMTAAGAHQESAAELLAAGELSLWLGAEPKAVLVTYYDVAAKKDPKLRRIYLVAGRLALGKHDNDLAADWFRRGLEKVELDPDLHVGMAQALWQDDRPKALQALDRALRTNPRHLDALVLRAEHEIDAEDPSAAKKHLQHALAVDPNLPQAHALLAVLAHLDNDADGIARERTRALLSWAQDPQVDHLIGRKLFDKYRFSEGVTATRQALAFDSGFLPAKLQRAQALLRLGQEKQEKEGWALAEQVHAQDGYDVSAFNLLKLRDNLAKLRPLRQDGLLLRMQARESQVYGPEVLRLLREARVAIDGRYAWKNPHPVQVEIFTEQADFAIRTFGVPGGGGYLGVCFGNLITMNSPAGNVGTQSNWQAVLWHEYTHVVTLGITKNKMPRWLSEGISVWEEQRRDASWGQRLTPAYKKMILGGELSKVGTLSKAFLNPKTPTHLMFAYFEAALLVEFVVDRYGFPALLAVLRDLGAGVAVNQALSARTAPLPELDKAFLLFAQRRAAGDPIDPEALATRAAAARDKNDEGTERAALGALLKVAPDRGEALARLIELDRTAKDLAAMEDHARRLLAVAPMTATGWHALATALQPRVGTDVAALSEAASALETTLVLDTPDPVDVRYRLATLLRRKDPRRAKRHLLDALADAPRFMAGHRLLLELADMRP